MLMPSIFGRDMFDDFFRYPFRSYEKNHLMSTDIKDTDSGYEVMIDMPGIKKENVKAELKDGNLTISTVSEQSNDEKDSDGRYIRRERYYGSCSRSFYVGEEITEEDIKAKFENGTLNLFIPKIESRPAAEEKKYITIEG